MSNAHVGRGRIPRHIERFTLRGGYAVRKFVGELVHRMKETCFVVNDESMFQGTSA